MANSISDEITKRASELVDTLSASEKAAVLLEFCASTAREISYRPHLRPGLTLGQLGPSSRKATFRLLSTAVSAHAFAQMTTIMGLEEVLDRNAGWSKQQHSNDYYIVIYGEPNGQTPWMWRLEGHHLSISVSVSGSRVSATPLFLGANPDNLVDRGRSILRPLAAEDEIAFALLTTMTRSEKSLARVSAEAPHDVQFFRHLPSSTESGVRFSDLSPKARELLAQLVATYVGRLSESLRDEFAGVFEHPDLNFAWAGGEVPGEAHYYRIHAGDELLIEYGNNYHGQSVANHSHTLIRAPRRDFGGTEK